MEQNRGHQRKGLQEKILKASVRKGIIEDRLQDKESLGGGRVRNGASESERKEKREGVVNEKRKNEEHKK